MLQPKKSLGQHFLHDNNIARKIVELVQPQPGEHIIEIGPGEGVLTHLLTDPAYPVTAVEFDRAAVAQLSQPGVLPPHVQAVHGDILRYELPQEPFVVVGNLPYNISSPIFFHLLDSRPYMRRAVCMIQKEVAERLAAPPGSKTYGILSVLLGYTYQVKYEFTVPPQVFRPPPRVFSAVISLERLPEPPDMPPFRALKNVVKQAFNQRRKMLRSALKGLPLDIPAEWAELRAEQLAPAQFAELARRLNR